MSVSWSSRVAAKSSLSNSRIFNAYRRQYSASCTLVGEARSSGDVTSDRGEAAVSTCNTGRGLPEVGDETPLDMSAAPDGDVAARTGAAFPFTTPRGSSKCWLDGTALLGGARGEEARNDGVCLESYPVGRIAVPVPTCRRGDAAVRGAEAARAAGRGAPLELAGDAGAMRRESRDREDGPDDGIRTTLALSPSTFPSRCRARAGLLAAKAFGSYTREGVSAYAVLRVKERDRRRPC
mgnify:CR=1 FL=1